MKYRKENTMKIFKVVLLSCLLTGPTVAMAEALTDDPYVSVTGIAQIKVQPDTVTIRFQSVAVENDADSAKRIVDQQVKNILSSLDKSGFDQALLTRGDIQLRPEYEYVEQKRTQVGINATRNLSYQLNDVTKVNAFFQLLVEAKISHLGQINYALKEPLQWQLKARDLAVKDSISKAKGLALSYDAKLGKIYSINYQANYVQPILMRAMENDSTLPLYQNNQIVIKEQVNAVFIIKP